MLKDLRQVAVEIREDMNCMEWVKAFLMYRVFFSAKRREFVSDYQEKGPSLNLPWHFFSIFLLFSATLLLKEYIILVVYDMYLYIQHLQDICVLLLSRMGSCPVLLWHVSSSVWGNERFHFAYNLTFDIWSVHVSSWFFRHLRCAQKPCSWHVDSLQMHTACAIVCAD